MSSVLVKAYSDLGGEVRDCYKIFMDSSGRRDIVSWTGIIDTFAEQIPQVSLSFFCQLRQDGWVPDRYTLLTVLKACAELMIERHASAVHLLIVKSGFEDDNLLANALIHSYARVMLYTVTLVKLWSSSPGWMPNLMRRPLFPFSQLVAMLGWWKKELQSLTVC